MPLDRQRRTDALHDLVDRLVDSMMSDDTAADFFDWFNLHEDELIAGISDHAVARSEFERSMGTKA